jgi:DNA mismatch repair protein MLH1
MLKEYFAIEIDDENKLIAIPQICDRHIPDLAKLPIFILNLCTEVNWEEEQSCFNDITTQIADFYHYQSLPPANTDLNNINDSNNNNNGGGDDDDDNEGVDDELEMRKKREWEIRHYVLPYFRLFSPPRKFANDGSITQIASLDSLYRIFERC